MFDLRTLRLLHHHDGDLVPYEESIDRAGGHHDPSQHDPERALAAGGRIFRCPRCGAEIVVASPIDDAAARG